MRKLLALSLVLMLVIPLCAFTDGNLVAPTDYTQNLMLGMVRLNNGSIFGVMISGTDIMAGAVIRKTISTDNGTTWSNPEIVVSNNESQNGGGGASLAYSTRTGRLWLAFADFYNPYPESRVYIKYSDNNGDNWSTPQLLTSDSRYDLLVGVGIELTGGTLVIPHAVNTIKPYFYKSRVYTCADGLTWQDSKDINIPQSRDGADEMGICEFGENGILGMVRTQTRQLYQVSSFDLGQTWDIKALPIIAPDAPAALLRHGNNVFVAWNHSLDRIHLSIMSANSSLEWHTPLDITISDLGAYPSMISLDDTRFLVASNSLSLKSFIVNYDEIPDSGNFSEIIPEPPPVIPVVPPPPGGGYMPQEPSGDSGGLNFGGLTVNDYGLVFYDKEISSSDGMVTLKVDAGITAMNKENPVRIIKINDITENLPENCIKAVDLTPDNALFTPGVSLSFIYKPESVNGTLSIISWNGTDWKSVENFTVNEKLNSVSCNITHFSKYALVSIPDVVIPEPVIELVFSKYDAELELYIYQIMWFINGGKE